MPQIPPLRKLFRRRPTSDRSLVIGGARFMRGRDAAATIGWRRRIASCFRAATLRNKRGTGPPLIVLDCLALDCLRAEIPVGQLRLKEREDARGEREERTERNFGAQNRDVGFFGISRGIGNRRWRIAGTSAERECDSANRADHRADEQGEENAGPAEKSADHPEQPHVAETDAL